MSRLTFCQGFHGSFILFSFKFEILKLTLLFDSRSYWFIRPPPTVVNKVAAVRCRKLLFIIFILRDRYILPDRAKLGGCERGGGKHYLRWCVIIFGSTKITFPSEKIL